MKTPTLVAWATVSALLIASLAACDAADWNGYQDYAGPAYVVGTYTCVNPNSGQPDYCVEYSDGSSSMVPFWVYNSVSYGTVLTYSRTHYSFTRTSYYRAGQAPAVYHVTYHARTGGTTTTSSYGGMSYKSPTGRVVYRSASAFSARTSYSRH